MTDLILLLIFNSLFIIGIYSITQEGMILHFIKKVFIKSDDNAMEEEYYLPWIFKPLIGCPTCMSSIHSIYIYWGFHDWTLHHLWIFPIYAIALAGINAIFHKYIDSI